MFKRIKRALLIASFATSLIFSTSYRTNDSAENQIVDHVIDFESSNLLLNVEAFEDVPNVKKKHVDKVQSAERDSIITQSDVELIALITMAEAEGECEYGKRLVIDTILNRLDSNHFPSTVFEVVYQKNQFSSVWDGRADKCYVMDEICYLVTEELNDRTNYDVMFFTAGDYGKYGEPMFPVENHYFSKYE